jgi:hypothetical protein
MGILGLFFCLLDSTLAITSCIQLQHLIIQPCTTRTSLFWFTNIRNGSTTLFNLLSLVVYLFMMMNKAHLLIVSPLIITSGVVLVKIALKNRRKLPIIYRIIL